MILQILHINSIVSPLMDSKLFFKRFVMRNFLCVQFLSRFIQAPQLFFFRWKCAFNAAEITDFLMSPFLRCCRPKKDKNMC